MSQSRNQTSLAKSSTQDLATKPSWASEIVQRYGGFQQFSNRFSYARMNDIVKNPIDCFRLDSPSLVRIDITYGDEASATWLYDVLQGMFLFLGVNNDKFKREQVYDLARTITSQYKTLKVAEILLFVSRFKAGKYGRFYGGDSYALVVTEAMSQFMIERENYYAEIERERTEKKIAESKKGAITFEEYKRMKEANGESVSDVLNELYDNKS